MSKRTAESENEEVALKDGRRVVAENGEDTGMGEFEDPYGDEYESSDESVIEIVDEDDEDEDLGDVEEQASRLQEIIEADEAGEEPGSEAWQAQRKARGRDVTTEVYLPHKAGPLGPQETLEPDPTVYDALHRINLNWPCLSFDILPDGLGEERSDYPATTYFVTGTQAEHKKDNEILVVKLSGLARTLERDDDDDDEEEDAEPILESRSLKTTDTTNRIRVSPHAAKTREYLTASLSESGDVYVWDLTPHYTAFDTPGTVISKAMNRPVHTIRAHGGVEGYAVDWSPLVPTGQLLTGDVTGRIYLSTRGSSHWTTDKTPFVGHADGASVEELQWSRSERSVFASGGSDGFVRIWDTRSKQHRPAISIQASASDVNVMSWNSSVSYLLASGHDDGSWAVWDLRSFKPKETKAQPAASFDFHKAPVTSIEFHPTEESIVAVSSADNTLTLWDLSVEADDEEIASQKRTDDGQLEGIPLQLLFVHWQRDIKELHWHKQIPGMLLSTGSDGMGVWKSISV
ncbi:WD40-repeat-containing domain protein [Dipodascopsis tothii]|uniref:WD40-repeat-containing domain protein n=1 Tax=Dipodascopsis tothii TaxID=44089 RepID=UPI0034CD1FE6